MDCFDNEVDSILPRWLGVRGKPIGRGTNRFGLGWGLA
jgi:hypothetical protein